MIMAAEPKIDLDLAGQDGPLPIRIIVITSQNLARAVSHFPDTPQVIMGVVVASDSSSASGLLLSFWKVPSRDGIAGVPLLRNSATNPHELLRARHRRSDFLYDFNPAVQPIISEFGALRRIGVIHGN